jgi:hypothetical protein
VRGLKGSPSQSLNFGRVLRDLTTDSPAIPNIMDTPKIPAPRDEGEKQVLEKLVTIRDQLQLRKLDRTTYVRTQDVMVLYDQTVEQVRSLNEIRKGKKSEENRGVCIFPALPRPKHPAAPS